MGWYSGNAVNVYLEDTCFRSWQVTDCNKWGYLLFFSVHPGTYQDSISSRAWLLLSKSFLLY